MHVIVRKSIKEFCGIRPDAKPSLETWNQIVRRAHWRNFAQIREVFPHADPVGSCVVFNISGNRYRLIARVRYAGQGFRGRVYIRFILTHREYDTGRWKADCDCG